MRSPFNIRYVDKTDPEYRSLPRFQFALLASSKDNFLNEYDQTIQGLKSGIARKTLWNSIPAISADGQRLTIEFLKSQIADLISNNSPEWVRGCNGVFIVHHPIKRARLISILSKLPTSPRNYQTGKLLSVCRKGDFHTFEIDLYEDVQCPQDSLGIGLVNPQEPAAEILVEKGRPEGLRLTDRYSTKEKLEHFAMDSLRGELALRNNILLDDMNHKYEPLGPNTFPDFELSVRQQTWAVEITRIEAGMVSYVPVDKDLDKRGIERALENQITDTGVNQALAEALCKKNKKRAECSSYTRYCLLLVDMVDSVGDKGSPVWNNVDLTAFDTVFLVNLDGEVSFIKGTLSDMAS